MVKLNKFLIYTGKIASLFIMGAGLLFLLLIFALPQIYPSTFGKGTVEKKAIEITASSTNTSLILERVMEERPNFVNFINVPLRGLYRNNKFPYLFRRMPGPDPAWVLYTGKGACGEYSILVCGLMESLNIPCRMIHNRGENHAWNEVMINGSWIVYDIGKHIITENPKKFEGWGTSGNISHVFYTTSSNKAEIDITERYTAVGRLIVNVDKEGKPIEKARIIIKSHSLVESGLEKEPIATVHNFTDSRGTHVFELGGNNYTITAKNYRYLFQFTDEKNVTIKEDTVTEVTLVPSKFELFPRRYYVAIIIVLIPLSILISKQIRKFVT